MKTFEINGKPYRLPNNLSAFQQGLYAHLIDWKWAHITREAGINGGIEYDAFLPEGYVGRMPMIYPPARAALADHLKVNPFRIHTYFNHMASSQAANVNLFLPVLLHPNSAAVLATLKPDFVRLATEKLDRGFWIEFWDKPYGNLRDKRPFTGTDADIAIAYHNLQGELCLWLIEHKLTEREFTTCGGARSQGRKAWHDCQRTFAEILNHKNLCYYHDRCTYAYWEITERNQDFFPRHGDFPACPFKGGMNQLWRNQLLALGIEQDERQLYQHVSFSVVRHPRNRALDGTLASYQHLIGNNSKFSTFTSAEVVAAAARCQEPEMNAWIAWYRALYDL